MLNRKDLSSGAVLSLLGFMALGATGAEVSTTTRPTKIINGTLLHRINAGRSHNVEFYQFGQGVTGVREEMSVDEEEVSLLESIGDIGALPLADIYRRMEPGKVVPDSLLKADAEALTAHEHFVAFGRVKSVELHDVGGLGSMSDMQKSLITAGSSTKSQVATAAAIQLCSPDFNGDNWHADWFKQHYCNARSHRFCYYNAPSSWTSIQSSVKYNYSQMEGDFITAGHVVLSYRACSFLGGCNTGWLANDDLPPRKVVSWSLTGDFDSIDATEASPCGHGHAATLWDK